MRALLATLAGLALLTACDPTEKNDFSCTAKFGNFDGACSQVHITDAEALVAKEQCSNHGGSWSSHACSTTDAVGYRSIPASDYFISTTDGKVFVYSPADAVLASEECISQGGTWQALGQ